MIYAVRKRCRRVPPILQALASVNRTGHGESSTTTSLARNYCAGARRVLSKLDIEKANP